MFLIGRLRSHGFGAEEIKEIVHHRNRWRDYDAESFSLRVDSQFAYHLAKENGGNGGNVAGLESLADKTFTLSMNPSIPQTTRRQLLDVANDIMERLP
jgi:hypothetical protein